MHYGVAGSAAAMLRVLPSLIVLVACNGPRTRPLPLCTAPAPDGASLQTSLDGSARDPVLLASGDIAACDGENQSGATAKLLDGEEGTILTLGDNAYDTGSLDEYLDCYEPTWGRHRWRTRPSPGNHDYRTPHAAGYFAYFCTAAGPAFRGYYSFDLGSWHIVSLNSNCDEYPRDVTCEADSEQDRWLRADLAAHPAQCTLAFWHHPRFSSGSHGNAANMEPIWRTLYAARADVVLSGHDHDYERFAPQTPTGRADTVRGIREFVVGTGGRDERSFGPTQPNSELRRTGIHGVLKLTLHAASYDWEFLPIAGEALSDRGTGECR